MHKVFRIIYTKVIIQIEFLSKSTRKSGRLYMWRNKEEQTTLTEDIAIAPPATQGGNWRWVDGKRAPAAKGMHIKLYTKAHI